MGENVLDKIKENYNSFSRSNKKIAKYILKNYDLIPLRNLNELKEEIGVSEATISRFSKILGYKNFNLFQKDFEQFTKKNHLSFEEIKSNLQKEDENFLFSELSNSLDTLNVLYSKELEEKLKEASKLLNSSKNIFILGSRTSKSSALFLYYMLREFSNNVFLLENSNDDISFKLNGSDENDILIAISYSKYTKLTYKLLKYFKKQNSKVVSITDSKISPLSKYSDIVLEARNSSKTFTIISTIVVINALVLYFANLNSERSIKFYNQHNEISNSLGLYLDVIEDK
ncbi:MAG: MurR/RpiR family transcriptional regulator [Peptoniphilus grossensis]|uniref:MurR/RpiR family transcriptional regulator n=1 Tax=Peptoniphilus grossensis TaxID=1465756 RepID=A0ABU7X8E1_9FIRM|nr:MurR/RpiR family transcriptional regulator [Peptoniphilus grossensis]MDU7150718.1 MurR/RpiR family transcriptional regulator [Peptoniphilus grossensis]